MLQSYLVTIQLAGTNIEIAFMLLSKVTKPVLPWSQDASLPLGNCLPIDSRRCAEYTCTQSGNTRAFVSIDWPISIRHIMVWQKRKNSWWRFFPLIEKDLEWLARFRQTAELTGYFALHLYLYLYYKLLASAGNTKLEYEFELVGLGDTKTRL